MSFKISFRVFGTGSNMNCKWDLSATISLDGNIITEMKPVGATPAYTSEKLVVHHRYLDTMRLWQKGFFKNTLLPREEIVVEEVSSPDDFGREFRSFEISLQLIDVNLCWANLVCKGELTGGVSPTVTYREGEVKQVILPSPMFKSLKALLSQIDTTKVEHKLAA